MKKISMLLFLILIIAFVIRFYNIDQKSVWYDEYFYFVAAQLSCQHPLLITSPYESLTWLHDHPYLSLYLFELSCFSKNIGTIRLINIVFTVLTIAIAYKLASKMFDEKIGLLSAFLLSISFPSIAFGRMGILDPPASFFLALACYMFYFKKEKLSWFIGGIGFAAKFTSGILLPFFIISHWLKKSFSIKKILLMLSVFVVSFSIFTIGSFISWDYLSISKNLHYKVPVIVKTVLFEIFFRPVSMTYTTHLSTVLNVISDQVTLPVFILSFIPLLFVVLKKIFKYKLEYKGFIAEKENEIIFLSVWLFLGTVLLFVFLGPHISLIVLVPISILISLMAFESIRINKIMFSITLLILIFYLLMSLEGIISSDVYFRPWKSQYYFQFFSLVQESTDYINENSDPQVKIYSKSLGDFNSVYNLKELPDVNKSIKIRRNITENIKNADYALVSFALFLDNQNSDEIKFITNNLKVEKMFGSNNTIAVFVYKK